MCHVFGGPPASGAGDKAAGRRSGLGWPPLNDDTQHNQPNDGVGSGGGGWERRRDREERVREDVYPLFRGVECSDEILKIESDGTLSFDGFRWMGGRNNQPKVGLSDGI